MPLDLHHVAACNSHTVHARRTACKPHAHARGTMHGKPAAAPCTPHGHCAPYFHMRVLGGQEKLHCLGGWGRLRVSACTCVGGKGRGGSARWMRPMCIWRECGWACLCLASDPVTVLTHLSPDLAPLTPAASHPDEPMEWRSDCLRLHYVVCFGRRVRSLRINPFPAPGSVYLTGFGP